MSGRSRRRIKLLNLFWVKLPALSLRSHCWPRLILLCGGNHGRAGHHAGILTPAYPDLAAAGSNNCSFIDRNRYWIGSNPHPGDQSGCPKLWIAFCCYSPGMFTQRKKLMGVLVNHRITTILASLVAALILFLNFYLLYQTFTGG